MGKKTGQTIFFQIFVKVPVEQLLLSGQKLNISMEKPQRKNYYDANDGLVVEIMD